MPFDFQRIEDARWETEEIKSHYLQVAIELGRALIHILAV